MKDIFRVLPAALVAFVLLITSVRAQGITCDEYIKSLAVDRTLLNGYIYGFVSAALGERGDAETSTAFSRVKSMADEYCPSHPADNFEVAVRNFTKVVILYRSDPNPPPNPWRTHKECTESALKLMYPRELNTCQGEVCKKLTNQWIEASAQAKQVCLHNKLGE